MRYLSALAPFVLAFLSAASPAGENQPADYVVVRDWPTLSANIKLAAVSGVAVDKDDNVFVFHRGKHPVLMFSPEGKLLRSWGDEHAKFAHGLRIDRNGDVWLTDIEYHQVLKFDPAGKLLLSMGEKGKPGWDKTHFNKPADIAFDADDNVYVADGYGNSRVAVFSKKGEFLREWGRKGKKIGEFDTPHGVRIDDQQRVVVADRENDRVQIFTREGKHLETWTKTGAPFGLTDLPGRRWLLADGRGHWFKVLDHRGATLGRWGEKGSLPGQFDLPHGIAADSKGFVYVTEITGKRIQKFQPR